MPNRSEDDRQTRRDDMLNAAERLPASRPTPCYLPDFLVCPQCLTVQDAPFDAGDQCVCGGHFVDGKAVMDWKRVYDLVGSVVAEARMQRGRGGHHLAVYGAIGKILIDRDEFDFHCDLLSAQRDRKRPPAQSS